MKNFTLYHYWRSSSSWRVRWALAVKKLSVKFVHVNLLDDSVNSLEHRSLNPMGFVPVLNVDGKNLIESVAIIEWLEENYASPSLFPGDSFQKQHIRTLVEIVNAGIQPVQNLTVLEHYSQDTEKRKAWGQHFIRDGFKAYEKLIEDSAGKYSVGDQITAADLFLVPQAYNALRVDVDLKKEFPGIHRIYDAAMKTPEAKSSAPENFTPATK